MKTLNTAPAHVLCVVTNSLREYVPSGTSLAASAFDSNSTVHVEQVPQWFADELALHGPLCYESKEELAKYLREWPEFVAAQ